MVPLWTHATGGAYGTPLGWLALLWTGW